MWRERLTDKAGWQKILFFYHERRKKKNDSAKEGDVSLPGFEIFKSSGSWHVHSLTHINVYQTINHNIPLRMIAVTINICLD